MLAGPGGVPGPVMTHPALQQTDHRPWPEPMRAWSVAMRWSDLLFMHWPLPVAALRPHVPEELEIDAMDGSAWLGIVPLRMAGVRMRCLPPLPGSGSFAELNVRTYVRHGTTPGVWFFSLDAASRIAVRAGRVGWRLPYFRAHMECEQAGGITRYRSERRHRGAPPAALDVAWRLTGPMTRPLADTPDHWCSERYCLFTEARGGGILRGEIHHPPWRLAPAEVEIRRCDMTRLLGLQLDGPPELVFAGAGMPVVAWRPVPSQPGTEGTAVWSASTAVRTRRTRTR
jgi:uncharacterized protein YqjF (DUF2071 family)